MVPEYNERYGVDLWKTGDFSGLTAKMENIRNITKRLGKAYGLFGDRIKYAGPDCGLGAGRVRMRRMRFSEIRRMQ